MTLEEFTRAYSSYAFDFSFPISQQPRLYDSATLADLPDELTALHAYRSGGRGRPNLNQTRTHAQCTTCRRVLRNDNFYAPPSMKQRNLIYPHCLTCTQDSNRQRYNENATTMRDRRIAIWRYIAARCVACGFSAHPSALDMHHLQREHKEATISALVAQCAATPTATNAEKLLREAKNCVPLCANCHRMLHAGAIALSATQSTTPPYSLTDLLDLLGSG